MPLTKLGILEEQRMYRCMISCEWKTMQQTDHLVNKVQPLRCCESQKSALHTYKKKVQISCSLDSSQVIDCFSLR